MTRLSAQRANTIADATSANDDWTFPDLERIYAATIESGEAAAHAPFEARIIVAMSGSLSVQLKRGWVGRDTFADRLSWTGDLPVPRSRPADKPIVRFSVWNETGATRTYATSVVYDTEAKT